jgi:hypothetical protein
VDSFVFWVCVFCDFHEGGGFLLVLLFGIGDRADAPYRRLD